MDLRVHKDRAVDYVAHGKLDAALAEYGKVLAADAGDVFARQRSAEILARLGRKDEAIAHYRHLVGKYAVEGHLAKAIALCHIILTLDADHVDTQATLADLYAERDKPRPAVRLPSAMCGAIAKRPSAPPPEIDPDTVARIPLFSDVDRGAFLSMLGKFRRRAVQRGEIVVEEGDPGDALFAIAHGWVRVMRRSPEGDANAVAEMGEGEFFGEMSLVSGCPRLASVVASEDGELLVLSRRDLDEIIAAHPSVGAVVQRFYKERLRANVMRASAVFRMLPDDGRRTLTDLFHLESHPQGALLLEEGKPGRGFFFLLRGRCDVFHVTPDGREEAYPRMREGDVFGELSILQNGPVTATVRAATPCIVLVLQREWFDELLLAHPSVRDAIYKLAGTRLERTQELLAKEDLDRRLV